MSGAPVVVAGAGGHAAVVVDALLAAGREVIGATDADPSRHGGRCCGVPVLGGDGALSGLRGRGVEVALGIGGVGAEDPAAARRALAERLIRDGFALAVVRHPDATVGREVVLGPGAQVMARAVVQPGAQVGRGAIVNSGAVVEHGVDVGAWAHVAPGAVVAADVVLGDGVLVGAGAAVRHGIRVAAGVVIGAGAAAVRDLTEPGVYAGVPCRRLTPREGER